MNKKVVIHVLGWVLMLEAICMIFPIICALVYGEKEVISFAVTMAICLISGILLRCLSSKDRDMYAREGLASVSLGWVFLSVFGALPFYISGAIPNYIDALFETVSGFSTTGATILSDVEALPKCLLFWRSFTHWIGGMGVLVFIVSFIRLSGGYNLYLLKAESTGPAVGKLVPKVQSTAKILYGIYTLLTLIQMILLLFGGLNFFDAITTAFGTAGTGGFGIYNSSVAEFSSFIQVVITVFMLIFGIDFSLYYLLMIRKFKPVFQSEELRAYLGIVFVAIAVITLNTLNMYTGFAEAVKHSAFQVVSIITTTGYSTVDFNTWPQLSKTILVILMFIGACAGSTSGGMKVSRILISLKTVVKELKINAHPRSTHKITMNNRMVEHETVRSVNVYIIAYFTIFAISLLIISLDNFDFTTSFTSVVTMINNVGPGLGGVGPIENFGKFSMLSKLVFIFDMLVGRLEIFPMLMLFSKYVWKR